jgi:hypothetical protein
MNPARGYGHSVGGDSRTFDCPGYLGVHAAGCVSPVTTTSRCRVRCDACSAIARQAQLEKYAKRNEKKCPQRVGKR